MKVSIDSYYEIGNDHVVCEDYALHGRVNDIYYALVTDGCSSSKHTDVGARLVAHATVSALANIKDKSFMNTRGSRIHFDADPQVEHIISELILSELNHLSKSIYLPSTAFDATLVLMLLYEGHLWITFWGDGCMIMSHDGNIYLKEIKYADEAPYYLSYKLDPFRDRQYCKEYRAQDRELVFSQTQETDEDSRRFIKPLYPYSMYWYLEYFKGSDVSIIVTSDGLSSYKDKQPFDLAKRYIDYKNTNGEFVQRRMKKIRRECLKDGLTHYDDISCAAMHLKELPVG